MQDRDTQIISPDGQSVWNGTEWLPYTPNAAASAPRTPIPKRPWVRHLGLKVTGGVLAVLVAVGIATAGGGEDTGAGAVTPTSTSTLPPVREAPDEESPDSTSESTETDVSLPSAKPPALTAGEFEITRSDGTAVVGTLALSEVMAVDDPRVEGWMDLHGLAALPCPADYTRDGVVLGNLHLENATPRYSIEDFSVKVTAFPLGAVGTHLSSGDKCGGDLVDFDMRLNPVFNGTDWFVPIQIVVSDYYSPEHPDGRLETEYEMRFAGFFDNVISPRNATYRGDLFDLSGEHIAEAPLRIRG